MRKTTKLLAIGAAIAIGTTGTYALAQPGPGMMGHGMGIMGMRGGPGAAAFGDPATRLAALKSELSIRPEQTAAWDVYAKVVQGIAGQARAARQGVDMKAMHDMSPQERQAFATGMREQHEQSFGAVRTAAETLLPTLDDAQKVKAREVLPGLMAGGPAMMRHPGMGMPFAGHGGMPAR
jgi:hypothetical protein